MNGITQRLLRKRERSCNRLGGIERIDIGNRHRSAAHSVPRVRLANDRQGPVGPGRQRTPCGKPGTTFISKCHGARPLRISCDKGFRLAFGRHAQAVPRNSDVIAQRLLAVGKRSRNRLAAVERIVVRDRCSAAAYR